MRKCKESILTLSTKQWNETPSKMARKITSNASLDKAEVKICQAIQNQDWVDRCVHNTLVIHIWKNSACTLHTLYWKHFCLLLLYTWTVSLLDQCQAGDIKPQWAALLIQSGEREHSPSLALTLWQLSGGRTVQCEPGPRQTHSNPRNYSGRRRHFAAWLQADPSYSPVPHCDPDWVQKKLGHPKAKNPFLKGLSPVSTSHFPNTNRSISWPFRGAKSIFYVLRDMRLSKQLTQQWPRTVCWHPLAWT